PFPGDGTETPYQTGYAAAFRRSIPPISIFHNPSLPPSNTPLPRYELLSLPLIHRGARPISHSTLTCRSSRMLHPTRTKYAQFWTTVLLHPRDTDNPLHVAALISSHPSEPSLPDRPHSPEGLVRLAQSVEMADCR
ncbi:hypothetical protein BGY98DRAFT_123461, partial [Russula aff. rugulosa BPL654]